MSDKGYSFRIVWIYVENWCLYYFGNIGIVYGWVSIVWVWCCEVYLVIDYDMYCIIDVEIMCLRYVEGFSYYILFCNCRVIMDSDR